jgi:hypothetical protein
VTATESGRLETALALAETGYHLAPVTIRRNPATGRKMPIYHGKWRDLSTTDPDLIRQWAAKLGPDVSWCIDCHKSGIVVVDLDVAADQSFDAVLWWSGRSLPMGSQVVDTANGGMHLYFRAHPERTIGNTRGDISPGVDTRGDGGHVYAPGSRIVGEDVAGWVLRDWIVPAGDLDPLPDEVVELLDAASHGGMHRPRERQDWVSGAVHDQDWVLRACKDQIARVEAHPAVLGTGFRNTLMGAAMVVGRAVAGGLVTRDYAEGRLVAAASKVWGTADPDDFAWIRDGLNDGEADPWTIVAATDPPVASVEAPPESSAEADPLDAEELYRRELESEKRKERLRRDARRALALEDRQPLQILDFDSFLDAPQVDYLIDGMLWRTGTSRIFGPPGQTKSFLILDIALSLATAQRWAIGDQDIDEPAVVHFVMAEGQAVNTSRALAWLQHHRVDRSHARATFKAIPQGVLLTPEGVEQYLETVERDRPALILLDTKHRMMVGDENSAADVAVLVRTLDTLKEACAGHVSVIDHTGLGDNTRARGSSAVLGAMDTEVRVTLDPDTAIASAEVTRDKAAAPGRTWNYRLQPVTLGLRSSAVVVPVASAVSGKFAPAGRWFDMDQPAVPDVVARLSGRGSDAAKDIYRVLRFVGGTDGLTSGEIRSALDEGPRTHAKSAVFAGLQLLKAERLVRAGSTKDRLTLALQLAN